METRVIGMVLSFKKSEMLIFY